MHSNTELFIFQCVNPIDNIDLSLEYRSFLSTYKLQEGILGQFKGSLLPAAIMLANSSLGDGTPGVKEELLYRAAEAGQAVKTKSFEVEWQERIAME